MLLFSFISIILIILFFVINLILLIKLKTNILTYYRVNLRSYRIEVSTFGFGPNNASSSLVTIK